MPLLSIFKYFLLLLKMCFSQRLIFVLPSVTYFFGVSEKLRPLRLFLFAADRKGLSLTHLRFLSLLRTKCGRLFKVKCCFAGSYPQQAVYPQQSTAPVYPPAMQMSPQAPPYTDTPPAYSEVTFTFLCHIRVQLRATLNGSKQSFRLCVCRYTSPDMCFHLRCLVSCLRCPLPTLVLRCSCPCSHICLLDQWARMSPWLTIQWEPCTPLVQQ